MSTRDSTPGISPEDPSTWPKLRGIYYRNEASLQVSFRFKGQLYQFRWNPDDGVTLTSYLETANRLEKLLADARDGHGLRWSHHFPGCNYDRQSVGLESDRPLGDVLRRWIAIKRGEVTPETLRDYERDCDMWTQRFGEMRRSELTLGDLEEWYNTNPQLSIKRVRNTLLPLGAVMADSVRRDIRKHNPVKQLEVKRRNCDRGREPVQRFTRAEIAALQAAIDDDLGLLIEFAVWTGMRLQELFALRWDDYSEKFGQIRVARAVVRGRIKEPKTETSTRTLRLFEPAIRALARQREITGNRAHGFIFEHQATGAPFFSAQGFLKPFKRACTRADVVYRPAKHLRHTFASRCISTRMPIAWLSNYLGHADAAITLRVYAHWLDDNIDVVDLPGYLSDHFDDTREPASEILQFPQSKTDVKLSG